MELSDHLVHTKETENSALGAADRVKHSLQWSAVDHGGHQEKGLCAPVEQRVCSCKRQTDARPSCCGCTHTECLEVLVESVFSGSSMDV